MIARLSQMLIALVFLGLGGWALLAPSSVIDLAVTEAYRDEAFLTRFALACFGAQAVLFGLVALASKWTSRTFALYAVLLLPFFVFNWYFHYEVPVLTSIGMLDFAGNAVMFLAAIVGWRAALAEERAKRRAFA